MDNHPIPQDVTGFQFKLIGDMTVKQFAYLASGALLAWIFFILPVNIIIRLPISFILASTGAALAFLPVGGRPLDVMLLHFIEATFAPNQYIYDKQGGRLLINQLQLQSVATSNVYQSQKPLDSDNRLKQYLQTLPESSKNPLDQKEQTRFNAIFTNFTQPSALPVAPSPTISAQTTLEPKDQSNTSYNNRQETPVIVAPPPPPPQIFDETQSSIVQPTAKYLQKQLNDLISQEQELQANPPQATVQPVMVQTPAPSTPKQIPRTSIPFAPEAPNVIAGIIKDARGNVLPNILVEVRDKEGNPVRAFKTNTLGQFASATPLLNGTYTIDFEDTSQTHRFNILEVQAEGELLPIIEIISTDQREDLRKSLFGGV